MPKNTERVPNHRRLAQCATDCDVVCGLRPLCRRSDVLLLSRIILVNLRLLSLKAFQSCNAEKRSVPSNHAWISVRRPMDIPFRYLRWTSANLQQITSRSCCASLTYTPTNLFPKQYSCIWCIPLKKTDATYRTQVIVTVKL